MKIGIGDKEDILQTVYVNDFGDNYHRTDDEPSTELEKAARTIRRRYKNMMEYLRALSLYREYMSMLKAKHGGADLFKIKMKGELIYDFIPAKPRMKNTEHNRMLLKNKIIISQINPKKTDYSVLNSTLNEIEDMLEGNEVILGDSDNPDRVAEKMIKEGRFDSISVKELKEGTNVEFLENYFKAKNAGKYIEEEPYEPSLTELMSDDYDPDKNDTTEEDDVIYYQGNFMNRETIQDLQLYKGLGDQGWDSIKIMKRMGVSKKVSKIVKNQNKMNRTKTKKKNKAKVKGDDFLVSMMEDNDFNSFSAFEKEMSDFTSGNIFK